MIKDLYRRYIKRSIYNIVSSAFAGQQAGLITEIDNLKMQTGKVLCWQQAFQPLDNIKAAEFKVFSQWGDDGIIQYLIRKVHIENKLFIEFGVQDYKESNTRFLLMNDNWKGLIIDGSDKHIKSVKDEELYWRYDLTAISAFITSRNVNSLFIENGFEGNIGILSIDIDGNDYWVWDSITAVDPDIVIAEYNSVFGLRHAITVPYDPSFTRSKAHSSLLYWGASLKALCIVAEKKGYDFIGCNSNGNNAYFVKKNKSSGVKVISVEEGYVESRFRESRDASGSLNFIGGKDRLNLIRDMPVVNIENGKTVLISDLI